MKKPAILKKFKGGTFVHKGDPDAGDGPALRKAQEAGFIRCVRWSNEKTSISAPGRVPTYDVRKYEEVK